MEVKGKKREDGGGGKCKESPNAALQRLLTLCCGCYLHFRALYVHPKSVSEWQINAKTTNLAAMRTHEVMAQNRKDGFAGEVVLHPVPS